MDGSKVKIVYVITERNGKSYWNRIGVAFVNADGSFNVKLHALPVSGEMHIRDAPAKREQQPFVGGNEPYPPLWEMGDDPF